MDQTPIFFTITPRTTLNTVGACTVNVRTSTSSTMRVTVAVTVSASGKMLPSMIVYKGKPGRHIEREFSDFMVSRHFCVQERAWMDEVVMKKWVDEILIPHCKQAPSGIHPILLLDSYRCHLMASVVNQIQNAGIQVEHIPGGCTSLCQPIAIGIGKPLKNRVCDDWEEWMLEQGDTAIFKPPTRETLAKWIVTSLQSLSSEMVQNSWRHGQYSYFPTEVEAEQNENEDEMQSLQNEMLEFVNEQTEMVDS